MDASPFPSDSLCYQQKRLLMKDLSPEDTVIIVDDPTYLEEIASWEGHCKDLNMVKIGGELIHYLGVSETAPYTLKNVTRGYWGTKPAAHKANDTVYKLQVTINYGYEGIIPNLALQDKIAEYYADVAYHCGVTLYDFDGQEFLFNNVTGTIRLNVSSGKCSNGQKSWEFPISVFPVLPCRKVHGITRVYGM